MRTYNKTGQERISIHNSNGWQDQYERMVRWQTRLTKYNKNISSIEKLHEFLDTLYTCFQNIFAFKDWLFYDRIFTKSELNDFVNNKELLKICRDLANGTKHLDIEYPSVDNNPIILTFWNPFSNQYHSEKKIRILINKKLIDPFGLVIDSIRLWDELLKTKEIVSINYFSEKYSENVLEVESEYYLIYEENKQQIKID